jgi:hypothetical protein
VLRVIYVSLVFWRKIKLKSFAYCKLVSILLLPNSPFLSVGSRLLVAVGARRGNVSKPEFVVGPVVFLMSLTIIYHRKLKLLNFSHANFVL